ncbi:MAG TPA: hypothetical protein PKZ76_16720 [Xanthomonadaceae bacterium]|nr:hypothetical protein [Xanthomonadaceae bacterium]
MTACATQGGIDDSNRIEPTLRFEPPSGEFAGLQMGRMEQWSGALAPGGEVEIVNPYGDVYIRRGGENVGLSGVIQRLGSPAAIETIDLRASPERVRLEVGYPRGAGVAQGFDRLGRVDLAVLVPEGATLRVRTRDGSITGKRVRANIVAESVSGRIDLSTAGWVDTRNETGDTQLVLIGHRWARAHRARSTTGSIAFEFPTKAAMALDARTAGEVTAAPDALAGYLQESAGRTSGRWGDPPDANRIEAISERGDISFTLYGWMRESAALPPDASRSGND